MSEDRHEATPASLTLMAGPIDCRISPTAVNRLATAKPISWFERKPDQPRAVAPRRRRAPGLPPVSCSFPPS
jgi:poly-beta-hydroxyalkanoate depolymerase